MGLAASQARMLLLIARKSDLELGVQNICSQRLRLASDISGLFNELSGTNDSTATASGMAGKTLRAKTSGSSSANGSTFDVSKTEYNSIEEFYDNIDTNNDSKMSADEIQSAMDAIYKEHYYDESKDDDKNGNVSFKESMSNLNLSFDYKTGTTTTDASKVDPFKVSIGGEKFTVTAGDWEMTTGGENYDGLGYGSDDKQIIFNGSESTRYFETDKIEYALDVGGNVYNGSNDNPEDAVANYKTGGSSYSRDGLANSEDEGYIANDVASLNDFMDLLDADDDGKISDSEKENAKNAFKSFGTETIKLNGEDVNVNEAIDNAEQTYTRAETASSGSGLSEAEIQSKINSLQQQDKILELKSETLEVQHEAISTEYDSVEKVIQKNIKTSFSTFKQ